MKKKRYQPFAVLLLCAAMVISLAACGSQPAASSSTAAAPASSAKPAVGLHFTPGTYSGEADGFGGKIKVEVKVDETSIQSITVLENGETEGIGTNAIDKLPARIISKQSIGLDTIAGCTISSNAVLAAVKNALSTSGGDLELLSQPPKEDSSAPKETKELSTDVVIVGGGGSGMSAALTASAAGAKVILLEKMAFLGGAASISGGSVVSTGSNYQKEHGVPNDTADILYNDLLVGGHNLNDTRMTRLFAENVGATFDWLHDDIGVQFDETAQQNAEHSVNRQFSAQGKASGMNKSITTALASSGVETYLETRASELIVENGKVTGVVAQDADGIQYKITAKAVVLATGGFGNNQEMLPDSLKSILYYGPESSTGDGHQMCESVDAKFQMMEYGKIYPNGIEVSEGFAKSTVYSTSAVVKTAGAIIVDRSGNRVCDETGPYSGIKKPLLEQPDQTLFLVMDAKAFELFHNTNKENHITNDEETAAWIANNGSTYPIFVKNDTLEGAASAAGVDGAALAATVERYNTFIANGKDTDFGSTSTTPMGEGPYYIVEQKPRFATTLGGVVTTEDLRVVNEQDQPIEGLYACGELVGGTHGDDSMPGVCVAWAFTSGHLVGQTVADAIK